MAIPSRRREFSTRKGSGSALLAVLLLAAGLMPAGALSSEVDRTVGLRPYIAHYQTTARGMKLDLTRNLKIGPDDTHTLTNGGRILVVGFHEVSVFRVDGTQVLPKSYVYQGTGLINRRREVHFTPGSDTIRSLYKEQWYDLPYSERTLDRMSQQEQLRLLLLNDPDPREDISIRVADGKRVKDYRLIYTGEEPVETPIGRINALHFERIHDDPERKSDVWLAPAWDYLMVKTVHIEEDRPVEVLITGGAIDGEPLSGN